ncbi:hypothetical protein, partial [Salmonella enterica]|uniref:hypothetical protein n=1 Tax=Salmonella enterica TaxID=28901 RepID=UPI00135DD5C8
RSLQHRQKALDIHQAVKPLQIMESSNDIPAEVLAQYIHFVQFKINGFMVPTDKQKTIFKCLLKIDFSKDDLKQQLPDYSKFLNFQSCDDYIYKGEVYWREFRLLIFLHFNKFINSNIHYSKHIFQKPGLREQCIKLLEEGGEVNWKWFLPKMININRSSVLKKMFQLCKKQPVLTPEANIKVQ